jgi:hypothetical protein
MGVMNRPPPVIGNRPLRAKAPKPRRVARLPGKPKAMNGAVYRPGLRAGTHRSLSKRRLHSRSRPSQHRQPAQGRSPPQSQRKKEPER